MATNIASINYQRTPDFSYTYSFSHRYRPRSDINRPAGSLARSQACRIAVRRSPEHSGRQTTFPGGSRPGRASR